MPSMPNNARSLQETASQSARTIVAIEQLAIIFLT